MRERYRDIKKEYIEEIRKTDKSEECRKDLLYTAFGTYILCTRKDELSIQDAETIR